MKTTYQRFLEGEYVNKAVGRAMAGLFSRERAEARKARREEEHRILDRLKSDLFAEFKLDPEDFKAQLLWRLVWDDHEHDIGAIISAFSRYAELITTP